MRSAFGQCGEAEADAATAKIGALIDEGWDPIEAEASVTGYSVESLRRRDFMYEEQSGSDDDRAFDQMVTDEHARSRST